MTVAPTSSSDAVPPDGVGEAAAWSIPADEVAGSLTVDLDAGLTSTEASRRLLSCGANELEAEPPTPIRRRLARQLTDPLVVLLLVAIVISLIAWIADGEDGAPLEAIVIAVIVVLNAAIGTWQEDRAVKAVAALRRMATTTSTVPRDGHHATIPSIELVPGDLLLLTQGDSVGADCRLVESASLMIGEAPLTGESQPVLKSPDIVPAETLLADRTNMAYQGAAVTRGRGRGVVVATGMRSEIGRLATMIERAERERTPLQRQLEWLGRALGLVVVVLCAIVVVTILLVSDVDGFSGVVDALLVGVSLAVAAVPEGLPAIIAVVLALGVQRMASHRAVVKRLSSVETLGSASVVCTDKTGTLTLNEMSIVTVVTGTGRADITGLGYEPVGGLYRDYQPLTDEVLIDEVELVVAAGAIANDASLHLDTTGRWAVGGDPTEIAFLVAAEKIGLLQSRDPGYVRHDEVPFDSERKLMSTLNRERPPRRYGDAATELVLFTKGAPDVLVERCTHERRSGAIEPLTDGRRDDWMRRIDELADEALRTLAVAYRPATTDEPADPTIERDLILLGFVGIVDPPRAEAYDAVDDAQRGGVRVIMITGDHPRTAGRIAEQLGISTGDRPAVSGCELAAMSDDDLADVVTTASVYARVEPEHKLRIVEALQQHRQITAMTGDGVSDAPALEQADIGVAMGINGSEVSKEAADMILADDNFATFLRAVREGREIFADIQKFLRYLLASNTGEVLVVLLGVLLAVPLGLGDASGELAVPLLATQILWINLVTASALALALGVDPSVEDVMARPPRPLTERVIDREMLVTILLVGGVTAIVGLVALDLELSGGLLGGSGDIETARTMVFVTLVLSQVVNAFNARSDRVSAFVRPFDNRLLWLATAVTVVSQVAVVHVSPLGAAFGTEPLTLTQWATCAGLASVVLVADEIRKLVGHGRDAEVSHA